MNDMRKYIEIKKWTYEDYPSYDTPIEGVKRIPTSGDEKGTYIYSNVEYEKFGDMALHLQIMIPQTRNTKDDRDTLYPCIVYVQGSAWKKQNINAKLGLLSRLSERGYVIAVVEYRHSEIAPFPAQALDVRNAIRFMKVHAGEYNVDEQRMVVGGDSSGAHAAFFSQLVSDDVDDCNQYPQKDSRVKGILSFYGALSAMLEDGMPSTLNHHQPDSPEGLEMGGVDLRERPDLCRQMSVECQINEKTALPPILMFHGTKDRTINPEVSVQVYRTLKKFNKDARLYLLEGADHGGSEFFSEAILDIVEAFIKNKIG